MSGSREPLDVIIASYGITEEAGGPGVAAEGFARTLSQAGEHVHVLAMPRAGRWLVDRKTSARDGYELEILRAQSRWPQVAELAKRIRELVAASPRPIVWINGIWGPPSLGAGLACVPRRTPFVVRPAGSLGHAALKYRAFKKAAYYRMVEHPILRFASGVHCMSAVEVRELPDDLRSRAFIVPSGIDVPPAVELEPPSRLRLGVLARIHPIKRQHLVLDACERLVRDGLDAELEFAGSTSDEPYAARLRARVDQSEQLRGRVRFLGHVNRDDVFRVVSRWSVGLLLSEQENFGHAVLSVSAAGVPSVLASGVALSAEVATAGAARIAEPDAASVAANIRELLRDPAAFRVRARRFAESFSWSTCGANLRQRLHDYREEHERHGRR